MQTGYTKTMEPLIHACNALLASSPLDDKRDHSDQSTFSNVSQTPRLLVKNNHSSQSAMNSDDSKLKHADAMTGYVAHIAKRQDRKAFEAIYGYYAPRLRSWCLKQRLATETAEELVQETLIAVWRKSASFDAAKASVSTWIFTILRNKRIDLLRKENRPELKAEDFELLHEPEKSADIVLIDNDTTTVINQSLALLSPDQRSMIMKAFFEEKSHNDIAAETGLPLGTVKSRIRLALIRLKISIGPQT